MAKYHLIFNLSDYYVPYFSVCLLSLLERIRSDTNYKISVLEQNISKTNQKRLLSLLPDNVSMEFVNLNSMLHGTAFLPHSHVSIETFFKLYVPSLFAHCSQVLFCDADIIFNRDPAELCSLDIGKNKLAAAPCLLWRGIIKNNEKAYNYTVHELKISDTDKYFQCGVLIFNNDNITRSDKESLLAFAQTQEFVCMDQDVLNHCFHGQVHLLDSQWNYETAQAGFLQNSIPFMDEVTRSAYNRAKENPYIIHYSGAEKPWFYPDEEYAALWWSYAEKSPWHATIINRLDTFRMIKAEVMQLRNELEKTHFPNINRHFAENEKEMELMVKAEMQQLRNELEKTHFPNINRHFAESEKEMKLMVKEGMLQLRSELEKKYFPDINRRFAKNEHNIKLVFVMMHLWTYRFKTLCYFIIKSFMFGKRHDKCKAKYNTVKELLAEASAMKSKLFTL